MIEENPLSNRELEILKLVAQGKSNKELASELFISVNTVKVHLSNIFQKLNVSSRAEAIVYAIETGLIESPRQETPEPQIITEFIEAEAPKWLTWLRKFWWIPAIALILLIIGLSIVISRSPLLNTPTPTPDPFYSIITQNRWQDLEVIQPPRTNLAAASYRQQIFAIGGETLEGISALNQSFNTRNDQWVRHTPKPTPVKDASAIVLSGNIFVFGGELSDGQTSNVLEVYNIESDTWVNKKPAPIALSRYAATSYEGKIYFFGGWNGHTLSDNTLIYDPTKDTWTTGTTSPVSFADAFAVVANDRIMVIGGTQNSSKNADEPTQTITTLQIFTPSNGNNAKQTWSEPLSVFESKKILAVQSIGDSIVVFSVLEDEQLLISYYSIHNETWMHNIESSQTRILNHAATASQAGAVYFIGGLEPAGAFSSNFARYQAIFTIMLPAINN